MPIESILSGLIAKMVLEPLVGGIKGYFNLPTYLKIKKGQLFGRMTEYTTEKQFWRDAIGPYFYQKAERKLNSGHLIKLKNFIITEWFPRCPGIMWTQEGQKNQQIATKYYTTRHEFDNASKGIFLPAGKSKMILGGFGSIRLAKTDDRDYHVLCATSSGICDGGIPLVVTTNVYDQIKEELFDNGAILATLEGIYSEVPIDWGTTVMSSPSSDELVTKLRYQLSNSLHIPRNCLLVESRLQLGKISKIQGKSVRATAWTLYKDWMGYSFTYSNFDPRNEDTILRSVQFIEEYVAYFGGKKMLTEFDGKIRRIRSTFPHSDVFNNRIDDSFIDEMIRWGKEDLTHFTLDYLRDIAAKVNSL